MTIEICQISTLPKIARGTHSLEVHALHRLVHAFHDTAHTVRDAAHRHRSFHSARYSINARSQTKEVQSLCLLPDGILGIDPSAFLVTLLKSLQATVSHDAQRD
jgi:hypothetical protein